MVLRLTISGVLALAEGPSWTEFEPLRVEKPILVVFGSIRATFVWKPGNAEALLQADGVSATDGSKMLLTPTMAGNCENDPWFELIRF